MAENVTASLLELRQLMHSQVKQSEDAVHVLGATCVLHVLHRVLAD